MEVAPQIAQLLSDTLRPDCGAVSTANEALNRLFLLPDFPFVLFFLALEAGDEGQNIVTATYLKNFTRRNVDDAHQPSKVSKESKDKLFLVLLQAQPPVLKVLVDVFVKQNSWPKLVPDLLSAIQNSNILINFEESRCKSINAITVLHTLLRPFQEPIPLQLELIAKEILVSLLAVFHQYVEKDFKITGMRETEVEKTLLMVCKCMYFAVRSYMRSTLAPLLSTFCHDLISILGSVSLDHVVYFENECLMRLKTKKRSLQIFCVLFTRHRKYSDKLMPNIINCVLNIVKYSKIISQLDYLLERTVLLAFDVISRALETGLGWRLVSPHFSSLLDSTIFPALVMNEKEEVSGWRDDLFTARKSALNLLGGPPMGASCNGSSASLKSYFGVLMTYGGLLDLRLLPLYKSLVSLPYLIGLANWVLGEFASCLPEEISANIYSLLLKALTMTDGDISAIGDQIPKIVVVEEGFELLSNATTSRPSHPKSDQLSYTLFSFGDLIVYICIYSLSSCDYACECSYVSFHVCFKHFSGCSQNLFVFSMKWQKPCLHLYHVLPLFAASFQSLELLELGAEKGFDPPFRSKSEPLELWLHQPLQDGGAWPPRLSTL
ncbi:hypothetical protein UlMin_020297 [Ulmus minor]